ncbi:MAG: rod shape-determining protein RodA [Magnetospirillum sp. WYHS-4]
MSIGQRLLQVQWLLVLLLCLVATAGFVMLFSAASGKMDPWSSRQIMRFGASLLIMLVVALTDVRLWMKYAYPFYLFSLVLLVAVELVGVVGMGAQRWIDLGIISLQPSELMKIALVLALARYFHGCSVEDVGRIAFLVPPLLMVVIPSALVLRQPDLGTALMLVFVSLAIFFLAGVRMWKFWLMGIGGLSAAPVAWNFLRDYQKQRILTFLDPERDPLGAGYHIIQSKIALGSGGVFGKGFLQGSQAHLNFLPEKQTDFIFTMLAEEFGMAGGVALVGLYSLIVAYGFAIAIRCRSQFTRLVTLGVTTTFFLYVFINIAMVMGLIPVVGVPLPLISYGGTAMMTLMLGFGFVLGAYVNRDVTISRRGGLDG